MSLKKMMKLTGFQLTVLFLALTFVFVVGTCENEEFIPGGGTSGGGTIGGGGDPGGENPGEIIPSIDFSTELSWGTEFTPFNLGLTPGNDTTEVGLNWLNTNGGTSTSNKVTKVRFIRGTRAAGYELIEEAGVVATATSSSATYHRVTVTGLKPGASYQYSVCQDGTNWSPMYDFKVPPATGKWTFAVITDPQIAAAGTIDAKSRYSAASDNATGWLHTMAKVAARNVSFIVSCGDQVDSTSTSSCVNEYNSFFAPPSLRNLPFAPTVGNHDTANNFRYYFNRPNDKYLIDNSTGQDMAQIGNYYYRYNNILFVVLNDSAYPTNSSGATTYITRFETTIKAAKTAHAGKYDWLIVQHHKSTASVAEHLADTDIQYYVVAGFETLMSTENVDFVIAGHDHVYARSYPLQGMGNGLVSMPDRTTTSTTVSVTNNGPVTEATVTAISGKPIYLTFSSSSGQKYYQVAPDPYSVFNSSTATNLQNNTTYPYLGANAQGTSTLAGTTEYKNGYLPVSNAAYVQPYIPSYCVVEVDTVSGRPTITFSTYAIATISGTSSGASMAHSFNENVPFDKVTVTK